MEETIQFQNPDTYRGSGNKGSLSFPQIILMHIHRCVLNGSVEWHGGYWQEKFKENWTEKHYVQNSRDIFNNSVTMLRVLLLGYFDDKTKKIDEKIQKDFLDAYKKYKVSKETDAKLDYDQLKIDLHVKLLETLILLAKSENFFQEEGTTEDVD